MSTTSQVKEAHNTLHFHSHANIHQDVIHMTFELLKLNSEDTVSRKWGNL